MNSESITCPSCKAVGWIEAHSVDEKVEKTVICGNCKHDIKYSKKAYKGPVLT